jgi:glycosyltransferase involved in cell wall biosynthesis
VARPARHPLAITYLLEDTALFGGTKVALHQANLMARRGHRVTVVSPGPLPDWYPVEAHFHQVAAPLANLSPAQLPPADVVVATFWTTIAPALALAGAGARAAAAGPAAVHFCQGFEASYTHNQAEHPAILAAYAHPLPAMAVAPHLAALLRRRFGRPARVVTQPLEPFWRPEGTGDAPAPPGANRCVCAGTPDGAGSPGDARRMDGTAGRDGGAWPDGAAGQNGGAWPDGAARNPPRLLVASPFEIDWKGVETALSAVRLLRQGGLACCLVRLSQWPLTAAERELLAPDEFHENLRPPEVARLVAGCDLLLAPSWEQEGFGLPVLEAMACGVPVVASDVSCYRDFAAGAALLVPPRNAAALAAAARTLLCDPKAWDRARRAGLAVAREHREDWAATSAEEALRWVAGGSWRGEA